VVLISDASNDASPMEAPMQTTLTTRLACLFAAATTTLAIVGVVVSLANPAHGDPRLAVQAPIAARG
jgi:hypothetical protein